MTGNADAAVAQQTSGARVRLGFVKLAVRDLDRMQAFYMRAFDLILHRVVEDAAFTEVILKWAGAPDDNARVILFHHKDGRDLNIGNGYGPLGIYVADVDAVIERAVAMGAILIEPAYDLPLFRIAFVNDPEGHELELLAARN